MYTVYAVHLAVILIWRFGRFSSDYQIKITANIVVLSQALILMMNELIRQTKCLPICFPSQTAKLNVCQMYHSYGIYSIENNDSYIIIDIHTDKDDEECIYRCM